MSDDLAATLRAILEGLDRIGIDYMLVGSVAALAHGRARSTQGFDVVVKLDARSLDALIRALPESRFYVSADAARDALARSTLFNVIDTTTGWKVDLVPLKPRAFSRREFARRARIKLLGEEVFVATVEDVIASKLEWSSLSGGSDRQREDVRELLRLHAERLDLPYIEAAVRELHIEDEWSAVRSAP